MIREELEIEDVNIERAHRAGNKIAPCKER